MLVKYYKEYKNQKNNAFCKMGDHKKAYHTALIKRLAWLSQLGLSKLPQDQAIYKALCVDADKRFGRSPENGNCFNTGLAALGGAVAKLYEGDLSEKQIANIDDVLLALHHYYPDLWDGIDYQDINDTPSTTNTFDKNFEIG